MQVEVYVTAGPAKGKHFTFNKPDSFLFGRSADAHISLPQDQYVSRQHFILEISPPKCKLTDLNSKNGVIVNGIRYGGRTHPTNGIQQAPEGVKDVHLKNGDEIVVGDTHIKILIRKKPARKKTATESHPALQPVLCSVCGKDMTQESGNQKGAIQKKTVCASCRKQHENAALQKILKEGSRAEAPHQSARHAPSAPFSVQGYHVEQELKHRTPGTIYKAQKLDTGQHVAIKVLLPYGSIDQNALQAFHRELAIIRQLKHPNIVRFIEHGEHEGTFYFIFEFIEGINIASFLHSKGGRVSIDEAAPIWLGVLDGLAYAHRAKIVLQNAEGQRKTARGIVHRNLKPRNILLVQEENSWIPKITDFGLAKSFESAGFTDITVPGDVLGTPLYWPREQITHYKYLNPATDVFSVAAIFYEMVTGSWVRDGFKELFKNCKQLGRLPSISDYMNLFANHPPVPLRRRNPEIPEPVAQVLDRALREQEVPYDVTQMHTMLETLRYHDAAVFRDALVQALKEIGVTGAVTNVWKRSAQKPEAEHKESTSTDAIMYSIIKPAARREMALFLLDFVESTQYILDKGDTDFSTLIGATLRRVRKHASSSELIFLKSTGDGFLAVYPAVSSALSLALTFLEKPVHPDVHIRMALHWGTVNTGPDGDVLGSEVRRVFRIEKISLQDQVKSAAAGKSFPADNRILATRPVLEHLDPSARARFQFAGEFQIDQLREACCELWVLSKP